MARPRKEVKLMEDQILELASYGLSNLEIAATARISARTLDRNYAELVKEGHERRNGSIRRKQYEVAMNGNATMLIWLGKQFLGQADKIETEDKTDYAELMRLASEKMA